MIADAIGEGRGGVMNRWVPDEIEPEPPLTPGAEAAASAPPEVEPVAAVSRAVPGAPPTTQAGPEPMAAEPEVVVEPAGETPPEVEKEG